MYFSILLFYGCANLSLGIEWSATPLVARNFYHHCKLWCFLLHCTATAAVAVTAEIAWNFVCSKDNAIDRNPTFPDTQKLSLSQMSAAVFW